MNLPFFIARRYLFSKKSHNAINIISIISVIGVLVGTMALIVVLSAFNGISDLVKDLYKSFDPDIRIVAAQGKTFSIDDTKIKSLIAWPELTNYSFVLEENALVKYGDKQCIATLKAVDDRFERITQFDTLIKEGEYILKDDATNYCLLGRGVAYQLQINNSDPFTPVLFYVPRKGLSAKLNPEDGFSQQPAFPSGIFSVNDEFDYKYVIVSLDFAAKLLDADNKASSLEIRFDNKSIDKQLQDRIQQHLGEEYTVKNREQQNELLYKTFKSEKLWTFIILLFILIIATFNVIGSIAMLILDKKKDVRTLWSMGADKEMVRSIFMKEGMLITFLGAFGGVFLGLLLVFLQQKFSLIKFDEGFVVEAYPVKILLMDVVYVLISVFIIGYIAAWYPVKYFTDKFSSSKTN
ncbi:MAG: ABC transporter permease [Bacteroidetes bacterium]|nr:ABC transporter permease [Bacteroidota bacterium]